MPQPVESVIDTVKDVVTERLLGLRRLEQVIVSGTP